MANNIIVQLASPERKYVKVYHDFLRCSLLTAEEKIVFIVLKSFIDFSGDLNGAQGEVFPTVDTICKLSSLSKPRTIRTIKSLVQKGIVKKIQRGLTKSNLYVLADYASMWNSDTIDELKEVVENEGAKPLTIEEHIEALKKLGCQVEIKEKELPSVPTKVTEESSTSSDTDNNTETKKMQYPKSHPRDFSVEDIKRFYDLNALRIDFENTELIDVLDRVTDILYDLLNTSKPTIRIGKEDKPAEVVKARLKKLDMYHIKHMIETYSCTETKIEHSIPYLTTMLYNAKENYEHWLNEKLKENGVK